MARVRGANVRKEQTDPQHTKHKFMAQRICVDVDYSGAGRVGVGHNDSAGCYGVGRNVGNGCSSGGRDGAIRIRAR